MIPILIYLVCLGLIFKGLEIVQIAYCSTTESPTRTSGLVLGILCVAVAIIASLLAVSLTGSLASNVPRF